MDSKLDDALKQQAIEWLVRLRADDLSDAEMHAFAAWLAQDCRHSEAFAFAEDLFDDMVAAGSLTAPAHPLPEACLTHAPLRPAQVRFHQLQFSRSRWGTALLALAAVWLFAVTLVMPENARPLRNLFSDYHTETGELRDFELADGSHLLMNTDSAVSVEYDQDKRRIILHHGQIRFTVAQDQQRPFEVISGALRVRALGTIFDVKHSEPTESSVVVQEHAVLASLANNSQAADSVEIHQGQMLHHRKGQALQQPQTANLQQAIAWQQHRLIINDRPLFELIHELERYRSGRIFISDASLKNQRVTGVFSLDNPRDTLRIVCEALNLRHTQIGPWWTVLHR